MGRREAKILVVGLVAMAVFGVALFGGYLPGLKPNYTAPGVVTLNGQAYYVQYTALKIPFFANTTAPWNESFRNVTFTLWLTDWYSIPGGIVHGIGTEANGSAHGFTLGTASNGTRPVLYMSPDGEWGAAWTGGWFGGLVIQLLVKV